jgi:hypothetical protein
VTTDGKGNVYLTGSTTRSLDGTNAGGSDAFVRKYNSLGNTVWTRQLGTTGYDTGYAVAADANGRVYISGVSNQDAFVAAFLDYPAGDFNGDARVDSADYVIWRNTLGQAVTPCSGADYTCNGFIGNSDYQGWRSEFGASLSEGTVVTDTARTLLLVPETSPPLLILSGVVLSRRRRTRQRLAGHALFISFLTTFSINAHAQMLTWTQSLSSTNYDEGRGVAADGQGNVYVTGITWGSLAGENLGASDVFIGKFNASGTQVWLNQIGTYGEDRSNGVAVDALGNPSLAGRSPWKLEDEECCILGDAFVRKYDTGGVAQWTRRPEHFALEVNGLALDSNGSVYTAGYRDTRECGGRNDGCGHAFVTKYDKDGNWNWDRYWELNAYSFDEADNVTEDGQGNIYVLHNSSNLSFITKYSFTGFLQWTRSIQARTVDIIVDGFGNIFAASNGGSGFLLSRYDNSGEWQWTLAPEVGVNAFDLTTNGQGDVFLTGSTTLNLDGMNGGGNDAFVRKYNSSGTVLWTRQLGSAGYDAGYAVAADTKGRVYIAGVRNQDAYMAAFLDIPAGDFNSDARVDGADYVVWRKTLGQPVISCSGADYNCNGFVGNSDYLGWRSEFGEYQPLAFAAIDGLTGGFRSVVPEPCALMFVVWIYVLPRRHRPCPQSWSR